MAVLVTGGSGFLGANLTMQLQQRGEDVVSLSSRDADLRDPDSLSRFSDRRYERIYHLAAWIQGGDFSLKHPGEQWLINQQINTTVLRWWAHEQPGAKLISVGSSGAYAQGLDFREAFYLSGNPIEDLFTYGMTKRMLHIGQMSLAKQYGLKFLTVIPSTLYGPNYPMGDNKRMQFIFDLARKILAFKHFGDEIVLWGDGYQQRELVYIDDFINDVFLLEKATENDIVNIGAGTHHTIRTFADLLCREIGVDPEVIQCDKSSYVGTRAKYLSTTKQREILGDLHRTSLQQGLAQTLEWFEPRFLSHQERLRAGKDIKPSAVETD